MEHVEIKTNFSSWVNELSQKKSVFKVINEPHIQIKDTINTYHLIENLSKLCDSNDIILADSGSLYYAVGQAFRSKKNQRIIVPGGLGTMGYALPAAIGASFASPEKRIVCIVGDGSLHTNVQELSVLSKHNLNIKIILLNNGGYASIRNTQSSFMKGNIVAASEKSGVLFPDWSKIAASYDIEFISESKFSSTSKVLEYVFKNDGPSILELILPEKVELMPAVISTKNNDGTFKSNRLDEMSPQIKN